MKEMPNDEAIWHMFNRISPRYDLLNRLLSFGIDQRWRQRVAPYIPAQAQTALDLATGTGDLLFCLAKQCPQLKTLVGIDMAAAMLEIAKNKATQTYGLLAYELVIPVKTGIQRSGSMLDSRFHANDGIVISANNPNDASGYNRELKKTIAFQLGNAMHLDFPQQSFDVVTMSFGLRNTSKPQKVIEEMFRVLNSQGKALILEFSIPSSKWFLPFYMFYFRSIMPRLGSFISKDKTAYSYLNSSVESFAPVSQLMKWLKEAGFNTVEHHFFSFGIASLYVASKS